MKKKRNVAIIETLDLEEKTYSSKNYQKQSWLYGEQAARWPSAFYELTENESARSLLKPSQKMPRN